MMKVLHIGNVAGVASSLVRGLRDRGIKAQMIERKKHPYRFPSETVVDSSVISFLFYVLKLSQDYDIVHLHSLPYSLLFNIDILAFKALRSKLVVHLHGTELRECHNKVSTKVALGICDQVLISTPDLFLYYPKALWLPNPIDPVFRSSENPQRYGKALYFRKWYEPEGERIVRMKCEEMGLELTVPKNPIRYSEMPLLLNQFEVFFDRFNITSLSKTALEALACGCKVIGWRGPIKDPEKILKEHNLEDVTRKLIEIYEKMVGHEKSRAGGESVLLGSFFAFSASPTVNHTLGNSLGGFVSFFGH